MGAVCLFLSWRLWLSRSAISFLIFERQQTSSASSLRPFEKLLYRVALWVNKGNGPEGICHFICALQPLFALLLHLTLRAQQHFPWFHQAYQTSLNTSSDNDRGIDLCDHDDVQAVRR